MWASMFKDVPNNSNPTNLLHDFLNLIKDLLVLINDCYHTSLLDWMISVMPDHQEHNNKSPDV